MSIFLLTEERRKYALQKWKKESKQFEKSYFDVVREPGICNYSTVDHIMLNYIRSCRVVSQR